MKAKPEIKEEDLFLEQINAATKQRKDEYEAKENAKSDEAIERARVLRAARKLRCSLNLILCAAFVVALYALLATENISLWVFAVAFAISMVCTGWHLNEAKRAFRRKG